MKYREEVAIIGGSHGDPFAVLGPHQTPQGWEVRAFLPQAKSVSVVCAAGEVHCAPFQAQGFYIARLKADPGAYQLRVDGQLVEDPYRFPPLLTSFELHLHTEGTHYESYRTLGAHCVECQGVRGVRFAVWAPYAQTVCVAGDFNGWDERRHPMRKRDGGVWELFLPGVGLGALYKYSILAANGERQLKCDPYAFSAEEPPKQASRVCELDGYEWGDGEYMARRAAADILRQPVSVYEVHLESWMRKPGGAPHSYRELADRLVEYAVRLGFTHLELMPVAEHPFSGSWGYQITGYYAPTARFGAPHDFMYFIDRCHQAGLGVIVDWVPAHFPRDAHGLARFDGSALYEHEDPRQGEHLDWGTLIFNYGRNEVRAFLVSNALFWLKRYHIDGLRVDAVASMLYLDYSRRAGDWVPNRYGGRENLEAIDFLRIFNEQAHQVPGAFTVAEESTSFGRVSHPVHSGGLGFTMKWNMGWMHDMFAYFKTDPIHRKYHHNHITFSLLYAFSENYLLPISHDEVVHGKSALIGKMPGDEWQRFANVRAFLGYMFGHPGKKLLFMGCELGQYEEWNYQDELRWGLVQYDFHRKLQAFTAALNRFYRAHPALYDIDFHWEGFEWVDLHDIDQSVIAFLRRARSGAFLLFVCNFTPVVRHGYRVGVPEPGAYDEVLSSDHADFGGSGVVRSEPAYSEPIEQHGRPHSLLLTLAPLAVAVYERRPEEHA